MACRWISALLTPCLWPHCAVNTECGFHCLLPSHSPQHPIAFGHGEVKLAQAAWQEQCQISPFAWGARVEICVGCVGVLLGVGLHHVPRCHLEELHASPVLPCGASHSSDIVCVLQKPSTLLHITLPARPPGQGIQTFGFCSTEGIANRCPL